LWFDCSFCFIVSTDSLLESNQVNTRAALLFDGFEPGLTVEYATFDVRCRDVLEWTHAPATRIVELKKEQKLPIKSIKFYKHFDQDIINLISLKQAVALVTSILKLS
jgi:hypothetical protein